MQCLDCQSVQQVHRASLVEEYRLTQWQALLSSCPIYNYDHDDDDDHDEENSDNDGDYYYDDDNYSRLQQYSSSQIKRTMNK